ncbi:carbohydrate-binding module family 20 domain-containing protein [Corallincola spongiicola]|uniref:CBM20 domain-containing protein n=1 Tax=Corallincola spongiicola TaxID=2520508 RepID=A0ABY1WRT4_9GAMM|nr:carbohydrate-binding module family 20 domain-containing protein [Corallincola spongiicola]TAA47438.1 hypothetical protein EXY25_09445 [Corallincola spongiicola]
MNLLSGYSFGVGALVSKSLLAFITSLLFLSPIVSATTYEQGYGYTQQHGLQEFSVKVEHTESGNVRYLLQGVTKDGYLFESRFGGGRGSYGTIGNGSVVYDGNQTNVWNDNIYVDYNDQRVDTTYPAVLLDLHWSLEKTLDFYKLMGRDGVIEADPNFVIRGNISSTCNQYGEASTRSNNICFGKPSNSNGDQPHRVTLDIVAHEVTHIVDSSIYLAAGREVGFYEGFTDLFGTAVKRHYLEDASYRVGENNFAGGVPYTCGTESSRLRDLSAPVVTTYRGQSWLDNQNCVYAVGSLIGHWYYLLSEGGSGTNELGNTYQVDGFGDNLTGAHIAYQSWVNFDSNTFMDMPTYAAFSVQQAELLYGEKGVNTTCAAWYAVGVDVEACDNDVDPTPEPVTVEFSCANGHTQMGQNVYAVGNVAELGNWDPSKAFKLEPTDYPTWRASLAGFAPNQAIEWKCIKRDLGAVEWQGGSNNVLTTPASGSVATQGSF